MNAPAAAAAVLAVAGSVYFTQAPSRKGKRAAATLYFVVLFSLIAAATRYAGLVEVELS